MWRCAVRTINAVVVDVDVVTEVLPGGAVSSDVVRLRLARCLCWRLSPRRHSGVLLAAAVGHQRLQNGPRARLAPRTSRPVVDYAGRLVDAVSWTVRAVGAGPVMAEAAVAGRGTGAVERASNVDKVAWWTVQPDLRCSTSITGTLTCRPVTLRQHRSIRCHTLTSFINPSKCRGKYIATSNNMKLVHWPLMGELLHLAQRGGDWAGLQPAQAPPRCTKCNSPPINGQCTNHRIAV